MGNTHTTHSSTIISAVRMFSVSQLPTLLTATVQYRDFRHFDLFYFSNKIPWRKSNVVDSMRQTILLSRSIQGEIHCLCIIIMHANWRYRGDGEGEWTTYKREQSRKRCICHGNASDSPRWIQTSSRWFWCLLTSIRSLSNAPCSPNHRWIWMRNYWLLFSMPSPSIQNDKWYNMQMAFCACLPGNLFLFRYLYPVDKFSFLLKIEIDFFRSNRRPAVVSGMIWTLKPLTCAANVSACQYMIKAHPMRSRWNSCKFDLNVFQVPRTDSNYLWILIRRSIVQQMAMQLSPPASIEQLQILFSPRFNHANPRGSTAHRHTHCARVWLIAAVCLDRIVARRSLRTTCPYFDFLWNIWPFRKSWNGSRWSRATCYFRHVATCLCKLILSTSANIYPHLTLLTVFEHSFCVWHQSIENRLFSTRFFHIISLATQSIYFYFAIEHRMRNSSCVSRLVVLLYRIPTDSLIR